MSVARRGTRVDGSLPQEWIFDTVHHRSSIIYALNMWYDDTTCSLVDDPLYVLVTAFGVHTHERRRLRVSRPGKLGRLLAG